MFIIDANNQLIAAEPADLARWDIPDIFTAARAFREGDLRLDREASRLFVHGEENFDCRVERVESLLGPWYFCHIALSETTDTQRPVETTEHAAFPDFETESEDEILGILSSEETSAEEKNEILPTAEETSDDELLRFLSAEEEGAEEETGLEQLETESAAKTIEAANFGTEEEAEKEKTWAESTSASEESDEELSLLPLEEIREEESPEEPTPASEENDEELSLLPLDESREEEPRTEPTPKPEENDEELSLLLEETREESALPSEENREQTEELTNHPKETVVPGLKAEETTEKANWEEEFFGSSSPEETIPTLGGEEESAEAWKEVGKEFHPDLEANAKRLELTENEYTDLLKEFIQDSHAMEAQLLDSNEQHYKNAAAILKDAINLLYLQPLDRLFTSMDHASTDRRRTIVQEYRRLLYRLEERIGFREAQTTVLEETNKEPTGTMEIPEQTVPTMPPAPGERPSVVAEPEAKPVEETPVPRPEEETPSIQESTASEEMTQEERREESPEDFLGNLQPIPIEFSLHIAAEELNLPEDLVLEFINDFDKQGHEYLPVLIDAYQKKDLDHLQKTAHMLKGAASNLRIEAMVDNLYDLQFDNDIERAPERIRRFAAQLMSLDNYLQQMNK